MWLDLIHILSLEQLLHLCAGQSRGSNASRREGVVREMISFRAWLQFKFKSINLPSTKTFSDLLIFSHIKIGQDVRRKRRKKAVDLAHATCDLNLYVSWNWNNFQCLCAGSERGSNPSR